MISNHCLIIVTELFDKHQDTYAFSRFKNSKRKFFCSALNQCVYAILVIFVYLPKKRTIIERMVMFLFFLSICVEKINILLFG